MTEFLIGIFTAAISTLGFSLLFRVDKKYLLWGVLGGALSWAIYLAVEMVLLNTFFSAIASAVVATVYSEMLAYVLHTPATVFLLPSLIPMVPGSSLYYTMSNLIMKDYAMAAEKGIQTIEVMLGVSGGVVAASLIFYAIRHIKRKKR